MNIRKHQRTSIKSSKHEPKKVVDLQAGTAIFRFLRCFRLGLPSRAALRLQGDIAGLGPWGPKVQVVQVVQVMPVPQTRLI